MRLVLHGGRLWSGDLLSVNFFVLSTVWNFWKLVFAQGNLLGAFYERPGVICTLHIITIFAAWETVFKSIRF